jgi:integrase
MAAIKYLIRKTKGDNPVAIYARFSHGSEVDQRARTGQTVIPAHWMQKTQRVRNLGEATYKDEVNKHLDKLKIHINSMFAAAGGEIDSNFLTDAIDAYYNPGKVKGIPGTLLAFIDHFIEKRTNNPNPTTGRPVASRTLENYYQVKNQLRAFIPKDIPLNKIDKMFYDDYIEHLNKIGFGPNTQGKHVTILKTFLNAAMDYGVVLPKYKSKSFSAPSQDVEHIYLTAQELAEIERLELSGTLDKVRDLFLIGAWTGLRHSDWGKINGNRDGEFFVIETQKTKNKVVIPIHSTVLRILDKYSDGLPKVMSKTYINYVVKDICKLAGINSPEQKQTTRHGMTVTKNVEKWELVSTHTARRSFATNAYKMGVPSITIMAITGHKTETSFLKYIKVTPQEHATKILEIWRRNEMKVVNYDA